MNPDQMVALLGVVLALFLVSRNDAIRSMRWGKRLKLAGVWLAIFVVLAIAANTLIALRSQAF